MPMQYRGTDGGWCTALHNRFALVITKSLDAVSTKLDVMALRAMGETDEKPNMKPQAARCQ